MSPTPTSTPSSTSFEEIFKAALEAYEKKIEKDLTAHPLAVNLRSCSSPSAILDLLQAQAKTKSQGADGKLTKWLRPTVNVLCSFSTTLGNAVGLVFPAANAIFTGIGVLLQAATDVPSSQDALINIFDRIDHFFKRLEAYIHSRSTAAMKDIMVKIMVEVLTILGILTDEIGQGRIKKYLKELTGNNDLEEALQELDKLTEEETRLASIEIWKIAQGTHDRLKDVDDKVEGIDNEIQSVNAKLKSLDVEAQGVGDKVQSINDKVDSANEVAKENKEAVQQLGAEVGNLYQREGRLELKNWMSPPDISANHCIASDAHHEGTSPWCIRDGTTFSSWKASGSLLWIHGIPGSGKSVLSSVIIRNLEASSDFVAYFYFDFKHIRKQNSAALLSSLLVQLSNHSEQFYKALRGLYSEHGNGFEKPNDASLIRCLKGMLTNSEKPIYIVMDALDECPVIDDKNIGVSTPREKVLVLLKELVELRLPNLRLCVTSRLEFDISTVLEPLTSHQLSLHDESGQKEDIRAYITHTVLSDRRMKTWQDEKKDLVINSLTEKAGGMFRWVICQLEVLRNCAAVDLLHTLEDLPKSLDETYERILKGVDETVWDYAYRLLQCLTVAVRPLQVEELAQAMVVDFGPGKIPEANADWRWEDREETVLSACSSLVDVIIDNGSRIIQFSHFSVKEFLISARRQSSISMEPRLPIHLELANATLAQACLCDLLQLDGHSNEDSKSLPLIRYAAEYWVKHAQSANEKLGITDTMYYFLDMGKPHFSAWVRRQGLNDLLRFSKYEKPKEIPPPAAPLYFAAERGFRSLVERMVDEHPTHPNSWGGIYSTPLHASVLGGHLEIAKFLASRGADTEASSADGWTPLHLAAQEGHTDIGKWLLDHVDVDSRQANKNWTPLHMATYNGRLEVAQILLEHNAEVNARDHDGRTPLHYASWRGHLDVVSLLLDRGADACVSDHSRDAGTPLYFAMTSRQLDVARILLEHKADPNYRDGSGFTFLHFASAQGHDDVVRVCLELSADVDVRDKSGNTPLHLAASNGNPDVTRTLLEHDAEVNARNDEGSTPLLKASDGQPEIVQLLLDWNADLWAYDNSGSTPLQIAYATESIEVSRLIFEHVRKNLPEQLAEQPQSLITVDSTTVGPP